MGFIIEDASIIFWSWRMESFCSSSLRVVLVLISILLLLQSPRVFAFGSLRNSKACGIYHISYLGDPNQELYYLNGKLVEKYYFCKALETYSAKDCFRTRNLRNHNCRLGFPIGMHHHVLLLLLFFIWTFMYGKWCSRRNMHICNGQCQIA